MVIMGRTTKRLGIGMLALVLASSLLATIPEPAAAAPMCDPTTLEDVHPDIYGDPTPTPPPETTSTTPDSPTTTTTTTPEPACRSYVKSIHSPLPFHVGIGSRFGADRDGGSRHHEGIDMSVPRLTPILAAADGVVSAVGDDRCCSVRIRHDDGWQSHYVHLNNDTAGTDDGLGTGIAPWVVPGARVFAGQVIGWVGDSTNAEDTVPHLHFELRMPNGVAIDAAASYRAALGRDDRFDGAFVDDDGHPAEAFLDLALSRGAVAACDERGLAVCPDEPITAEAAQRLVVGLTGFTATPPPATTERVIEDTTGSTLPAVPTEELPAPTMADLTAMFAEAAARATEAARLVGQADIGTPVADEAVDDDTTDGDADWRPTVGCLWSPPTDDRVPTLAEAVVTALLRVGLARQPECDFSAPPEG